MRSFSLFCFVVAGMLGAAQCGRADSDADDLLARAIKAHGGEEALAKHKALRMSLKVTLAGPDRRSTTWEWLFAAPNKFKDMREAYYLGRRNDSIFLTDGKAAWSMVNGRAAPIDAKLAEAFKDNARLMQALRLVPLREKEYELKAGIETKVDGKRAVGLLVRAKGQKDVTLYFDAESSFLVKVERKVIDTANLEPATEERFFRDYQKEGALPYARKVRVLRDGQEAESYEVRSVQFLEKVDEKEFRRK